MSNPFLLKGNPPMTDETATIKIYVACLAAYNNGILHGRWIDAMQGEDHIWESIKAMLAESPIPGAEEHAIHEHEGFEGLSISEYEGIENICALADFIAEHGELGARLLQHFGDTGEAREAMEDRYCGVYSSVADYAQEITEETTKIPDSIQYYIDWQRMARDLEMSDILAIETGFEEVHIFWQG
jgi:antirestriction protein